MRQKYNGEWALESLLPRGLVGLRLARMALALRPLLVQLAPEDLVLVAILEDLLRLHVLR
jgi:hypothetical protein